MVGELGSAFKHAGGGVTSWVLETTNPKTGLYAGYTIGLYTSLISLRKEAAA